MNKILIIAFTLVVALGWTISTNQTCACNELILYTECSQSCQWNTALNKCSDYVCQGADIYSCMLAKNCYFNSTQCVPFTTCTNIPQNNPQACQYAGCQYNNGACQEYSCTNFNSTQCPSYCLLQGSSCQNPTSCSQYSPENCNLGFACQLVQGMCVPATCNSFNSSNCFFVQTSLSLQSTTIQPCYLDQNYTCQDAEPKNLNTTQTCQDHTLGLYHWSSSDVNKGKCIACSQNKQAYPNNLSYSNILVSIAIISTLII